MGVYLETVVGNPDCGKALNKFSFYKPTQTMQTFEKRRHAGIPPERVTNVSNTEYPGHYPDEDLSWNLSNLKKVYKLTTL